MREQLARLLPEVRCLDGTAEAIPLPDRSVDVVLVAQAWHWVDPHRAVPEVARVLVPGGRLGLIWNNRDEREDWVKQLGLIMHGNDDPRAATPAVGPPFAPLRASRRRVGAPRHRDAARRPRGVAQLRDHPARRARSALLAQVRELIDTHPDLRGAAEISLPYVTECYSDGSWRLRDSRRRHQRRCPMDLLKRPSAHGAKHHAMRFDEYTIALLVLRAGRPGARRGRGGGTAGRAPGAPRRPARCRSPARRRSVCAVAG